MANKVYNIVGGVAYDALLKRTAEVRSGSAVYEKEGDFTVIGGVAYPALRFDTIPFGGRISGGNMIFQLGISDKLLTTSPKVVCLGSSTMAGFNLTNPNRLEDRLNAWLAANATSPTLVNGAVGGYRMSNFRTVANGGTVDHNIEWACAQNPTFIYIDEPTNWADSYDVATQISYMMEIFTYAFERGILCIFGGARPRTPYTGTEATRLVSLNPALSAHPILRYVCLDNFSTFLQPSTTNTLRTIYDQGDGIHINAAGTIVLSDSITAWWQRVLLAVTAFDRYEIERSVANTPPWTNISTVTDMTVNRVTIAAQDGFYRARARIKGTSTYLNYSTSVELDLQNPTANAGPDLSEPGGTTTKNITGTGTAFNGATIVSYQWTFVSGSAVTLVNANTDTVTVNGLVDGGSTVLRLTVTDSNGLTGFDDVTLTVAASFVYRYFAFRLTNDTVPGAVVCFGNPRAGVLTATNSGITVSTISTAVWANTFGNNAVDTGGETTANPVFAFTQKMTEAYMLTYQVVFNGSNYNIELSGFTPGQVVPEIAVLGSRDDGSVGAVNRLMDVNLQDANGNQKYVGTIDGNNPTGAYNVKGNTAVTANFTNVVAMSGGNFLIATRPVSPANGSHEFGYLCAIRIKLPA